jgi:hypothetical protein
MFCIIRLNCLGCKYETVNIKNAVLLDAKKTSFESLYCEWSLTWKIIYTIYSLLKRWRHLL